MLWERQAPGGRPGCAAPLLLLLALVPAGPWGRGACVACAWLSVGLPAPRTRGTRRSCPRLSRQRPQQGRLRSCARVTGRPRCMPVTRRPSAWPGSLGGFESDHCDEHTEQETIPQRTWWAPKLSQLIWTETPVPGPRSSEGEDDREWEGRAGEGDGQAEKGARSGERPLLPRCRGPAWTSASREGGEGAAACARSLSAGGRRGARRRDGLSLVPYREEQRPSLSALYFMFPVVWLRGFSTARQG